MPEISGPRVTGTDVERQMDDLLWRDMFGAEAGVVADLDGTAYKLTLPSSSEIVTVGSTSQPSLCVVGGFRHRISAGDTQTVTMTAMGGTARTDVISAKLDLTGFTGAPGPVRLVSTAGTTTAVPTLDDSAPGVEHLPLWAITRQPGQSLAQATVKRLFPRVSLSLSQAIGAPLPTSSPLDTLVSQGGLLYRRILDPSLVPVWALEGALSGAELLRNAAVDLSNGALENQGFGPGDVVRDVGGYYSGAQANTLTVPAGLGGLHLISVGSGISGGPGAARFFLEVYTSNGQSFRANGYGDDSATGSKPLRLAAGATIGVRAYQLRGSTLQLSGLSLSAHRIGG